MDDACHGCLAAVVDVRHGPCYRACRRDAAEERACEVCNALSDKLCVRVVLVTYNAVGHHGGKQRLNSPKDSDSESRREQVAHHRKEVLLVIKVYFGQLRRGDRRWELVQVSYCRDVCHVSESLQQPYKEGDNNDGDEGTRYLLRDFRAISNDEKADNANAESPPVDMCHILEVAYPFFYEVGRHLLNTKAEQVVHLCREDGEGDTGCEAYDNRIRHELDDITQLEHTY